MTISYQQDVSLASWRAFFKLLFRWKASIWKIVIKELFVWIIAFFGISFIFRTPFFLTQNQKFLIEKLANYFDTYLNSINLTFILGFFVSNIAVRWDEVIKNMGYIESFAIYVSNFIRGDDEETRMVRRSIVRYICLAQILVFRDISVDIRKRFPTLDSIVRAGYMLDHEKQRLESIKSDYNQYWIPFSWASSRIINMRKRDKIASDMLMNGLYDMICTAVYFYFGVCLISRQFIRLNNSHYGYADLVSPVMTMVQFVFYVGWMKVALNLLNPFGDDDDDFECNFLVDKNLAVSLCIVDHCYDDAPSPKEDFFCGAEIVNSVSLAANSMNDHQLIGSASKIMYLSSESVVSSDLLL
ncbi:unnamed protein product [Dracunculus medinensis]|uniref:Bestrophin homolog n=1 Tax=Dracunculus medinensis TaxID=318479 RepID=A0A0N4UN19_DRAME|nr:unnamed protein product [Dracunculus medinensis]